MKIEETLSGLFGQMQQHQLLWWSNLKFDGKIIESNFMDYARAAMLQFCLVQKNEFIESNFEINDFDKLYKTIEELFGKPLYSKIDKDVIRYALFINQKGVVQLDNFSSNNSPNYQIMMIKDDYLNFLNWIKSELK